MQLHYVIRKQVSRVALHKDGTTSIGIVLKDGVKTRSRPVIKAIKKGSIAYRSHCVSEKDAIVSVCGQDARGMSRKDFKLLLREAEAKIDLELEYLIQEACLNKCGVYRMESIDVKLKKESESYGFVLRKHGFGNIASPGYPIISNLKEGGPADRDGRLKEGDRLLKIDEQDLEGLSLLEVADILKAKNEATFTIEYKIALIENSQIQLGERTDLEINCPAADLGLFLGASGSRTIIEEILKGSLADRCGAFRVGDDILAINDVDVALLSTSKANSLLRSFKKDPGRLVLVANTERLARPRQNPSLTRERIKQSFNAMPSQLTPERDQRVPSSRHLLVPCNSPQSSFNVKLEDNNRLSAEGNYCSSQIITFVMLRELIDSIGTMENCISCLISKNAIGSEDNSEEIENGIYRHLTTQCGNQTHLKVVTTRIKNLVHSMAIHLAKNANMSTSNSLSENDSHAIDDFGASFQNFNQNAVIQDSMENFVELYAKKLISKQNFEELQLKINQIKSDCKKCGESRMLAALTIQKILLIASLNSKTKEMCFLIKKFIEKILRIKPCEDCRVGSESQTGSEISRTTNQFSSLNRFKTNPSNLSHSLKGKTSCFTNASESNTPEITVVNRLNQFDTEPSNSAPNFTPQSGFKSLSSMDNGPLTNETIIKASSNEISLDLNCKTKTIDGAELSNYCKKHYQKELNAADSGSFSSATPSNQPQDQSEAYYKKRYQRELKAADSGSLSSATESNQPQDQSEPKFNNRLLGFATPNHCTALYDSESISWVSTSQISIRAPNNTRNNSFSYQTDFMPYNDNVHYPHKTNDNNYSTHTHKKTFSEKGLLKAQSQNCKSAEVISGSDCDSLKHSKSGIQKHSSEPEFLSMERQSQTERVPDNDEKSRGLYSRVEILDGKREMDGANADANKYWSPFQRSDNNGRPNILDIPNWSAKSSHSLRQVDQVSNERTMQSTMDVTLRNEGRGYGLSVEFIGSFSEDSPQVPRITAVSSQGAAHKMGILLKGDRVLAINGRSTAGMTAMEFEYLKEQTFSVDEVLLTVEFDIAVRELQIGTFYVCVTKTSKTGLIYNDFKKGSPLVVKGIVKGSPAHRCGLLFPGDEVLCANNIRQEFYDVSKNTYVRSEFVTITVRRQTFKEKFGDEINLDEADLLPFKTHDLNRTSVHSNYESNKMFLEQELTLYRDPIAQDFGFLIGQDQSTKILYVTGIRPDGPADCSKVIQKNDIILQVNGVDLEEYKDGTVASFFHTKGDRLELKTRRMLKYE